jgi:hypothetical protein
VIASISAWVKRKSRGVFLAVPMAGTALSIFTGNRTVHS